MLRATTNNSRIGEIGEIQAYVYFKHYGKWYRALRPAEKTPEKRRHFGEWQITCLSSEGHTVTVEVNGPEIELTMDGKHPGPFQPGTSRRKAAKLEEQAERLIERARQLRTLADVTDGRIPLKHMSGTVRSPATRPPLREANDDIEEN